MQYLLYYNTVRPHQGLGGKTPLQALQFLSTKLDFVHLRRVGQRFYESVEQRRWDFRDVGFVLRHAKSLSSTP